VPTIEPRRPSLLDHLGPVFAALWLFFLLDPLLEAWSHRDEAAGLVGLLATIVFAAAYMTLWLRVRTDPERLVQDPPPREAAAYLAVLAGLAVVMVACLGEPGMSAAVYVGVVAVMVLPLRAAAPLVAVLVVSALAAGPLAGWGSQAGITFAIVSAALAILGMRAVLRSNQALVRVEQENARLAADQERNRLARDLHDILGHSLTVITVKAELAQRLLDLDVTRARTELADLERLSRDALSDVRRAVEGYRELTLPGELTRARAALAAAEIEARLPRSAEEVPSELRELFAWTVREGVTNVIRHSGARSCEVTLSPACVEVRDDGTGSPAVGTADPAVSDGSGLAGLRERAAAVGATVRTRSLEPGFCLQVARP